MKVSEWLERGVVKNSISAWLERGTVKKSVSAWLERSVVTKVSFSMTVKEYDL
jgi:hypothetical protein